MFGLATIAATAGAFNLICSGLVTTYEDKKGQPYTDTYRVNLETNKWCQEDCSKVLDIHEVDPNRITFVESLEDTSQGYRKKSDWVDRTTGQHSIFYSRKMYMRHGRNISFFSVNKGRCEKAEFTGFPTYETKF